MFSQWTLHFKHVVSLKISWPLENIYYWWNNTPWVVEYKEYPTIKIIISFSCRLTMLNNSDFLSYILVFIMETFKYTQKERKNYNEPLVNYYSVIAIIDILPFLSQVFHFELLLCVFKVNTTLIIFDANIYH